LWRANDQSNSIGNLLLHLCGNARQWIVSGLGGALDQRARQTEFDERSLISKPELLTTLKGTLAEVDAVLDAFDTSQLLNAYQIQAARSGPGSDFSCGRAFLDAHWADNSHHEATNARDLHFYDV